MTETKPDEPRPPRLKDAVRQARIDLGEAAFDDGQRLMIRIADLVAPHAEAPQRHDPIRGTGRHVFQI